jgi:hypothetical protein
MTEEKKSKNPFINMALEAKKNKAAFNQGKQGSKPIPKSSKGFGGPSMVKRSGRGG